MECKQKKLLTINYMMEVKFSKKMLDRYIFCVGVHLSSVNITCLKFTLKKLIDRVADPVGSGDFAWIRIRIRILNFSGSGSGFKTRIPDPVPDPRHLVEFLKALKKARELRLTFIS